MMRWNSQMDAPCLLTLLREGQAASVLQLPAQPKTEAEAREQVRVSFVG
jgi:hypothetical protein